MEGDGTAEQVANTIIAQALQNAGVREQSIELPAEAAPGPEKPVPSLDGGPKGQVRGAESEGKEAEPAETETESSKAKPAEPVAPVLGKADVEAAINQASSKFQGIMDKKISQLQLQMQQTIGALNQFFQTQEDTGIAGLPAEEQVLKRLERLEGGFRQPKIQIQTQPITDQPAQFYQQLVGFVDAVGLRVDDKRLDWAPDTDDPKVGFNRFLTSIKAALVADQTAVIQGLKDKGGKEIQSLRKKTGVDKVSTSGPGGAGAPDVSKMTALEKIDYGFKTQEELSQVSQ